MKSQKDKGQGQGEGEEEVMMTMMRWMEGPLLLLLLTSHPWSAKVSLLISLLVSWLIITVVS